MLFCRHIERLLTRRKLWPLRMRQECRQAILQGFRKTRSANPTLAILCRGPLGIGRICRLPVSVASKRLVMPIVLAVRAMRSYSL